MAQSRRRYFDPSGAPERYVCSTARAAPLRGTVNRPCGRRGPGGDRVEPAVFAHPQRHEHPAAAAHAPPPPQQRGFGAGRRCHVAAGGGAASGCDPISRSCGLLPLPLPLRACKYFFDTIGGDGGGRVSNDAGSFFWLSVLPLCCIIWGAYVFPEVNRSNKWAASTCEVRALNTAGEEFIRTSRKCKGAPADA